MTLHSPFLDLPGLPFLLPIFHDKKISILFSFYKSIIFKLTAFLFTNFSDVCLPPREVFVAGIIASTQHLLSSPCVPSVSFHNALNLRNRVAITDCPPLQILTSGLVLDCWIIFPLWFVFPVCFLEWVFLLEAKVNFALLYAGYIYVP